MPQFMDLQGSMPSPEVPLNIRLIQPTELIQRVWSSGTTTELFIYPPTASYEARDFTCRISTATVQSDGPFSKFPKCERILVLVSGGGLRVRLDGHTEILDKKYQQFHFNGETEVTAELISGQVQDFNLIFQRGVVAQVNVQKLSPVLVSCLLPDLGKMQESVFERRIDLIYAAENSLRVQMNESVQTLKQGSMLMLQRLDATAQAISMQSCDEHATAIVSSLLVGRIT